MFLVEDPESGSSSSSEVDVDVQCEMEVEDEGAVNSDSDNLSDGYLSSGSGSDASNEHGDVKKKTPDVAQPYLPPQLQSKASNLKLRKSINGLINRYCIFSERDCGFKLPY